MTRGLGTAFLRLFVVQASLNHDRMTGLGVAWATDPLLGDLPPDARQAARRRGTRLFNAHPYLAGLAVGAIARAEHDGVPAEKIERLRSALTAPLGAVGDKLVWAGTLPASVGIGLTVAVLAGPVAGIGTFLVLHNLVHLALRWWGLHTGQLLGMGISGAFSAPLLRLGLRIAGPAAGLCIGFALPVVAEWLLRGFEAPARTGVILMAGVGVVVGRWLTPTVGALRFGLLLAGVAFIAGWLWPS